MAIALIKQLQGQLVAETAELQTVQRWLVALGAAEKYELNGARGLVARVIEAYENATVPPVLKLETYQPTYIHPPVMRVLIYFNQQMYTEEEFLNGVDLFSHRTVQHPQHELLTQAVVALRKTYVLSDKVDVL